MKILHILGSVGHHYGGPAYSVPLLVGGLRDAGINAEIVSVVANQRNEIVDSLKIPSRIFPTIIGGKIQLSIGLFYYLVSQKERNVIFHLHTLWNMIGLVTLLAWILNRKSHLVISTRGYFLPAAIAKGWLRKKVAWYLFVKYLLNRADAIHVTSVQERDEILSYIENKHLFMIENIIPIQAVDNERETSFLKFDTKTTNPCRYFGTMCRIVPHKGIHKIIRSFAEIPKVHPDWCLLIAGPKEDVAYFNELQEMIKKYNLTDNVKFVGQVLGEDKEVFLNTIELFILLSDSENYGMSIAEALLHNIPVIATTNAPWSDILIHSAGWYIDDNPESILSSLDESLSSSSTVLKSIGENGSKIFGTYDQEKLIDQYCDMYQKVACK